MSSTTEHPPLHPPALSDDIFNAQSVRIEAPVAGPTSQVAVEVKNNSKLQIEVKTKAITTALKSNTSTMAIALANCIIAYNDQFNDAFTLGALKYFLRFAMVYYAIILVLTLIQRYRGLKDGELPILARRANIFITFMLVIAWMGMALLLLVVTWVSVRGELIIEGKRMVPKDHTWGLVWLMGFLVWAVVMSGLTAFLSLSVRVLVLQKQKQMKEAVKVKSNFEEVDEEKAPFLTEECLEKV